MISIRSARLDDLETIVRFQQMMALETENLQLQEKIVKEGVKNLLIDPTKGAYWVACEGEEVLATVLTIPEWSDWRNGTVLWIHSVYVAEKARQKGVFKKLYLFLKERVEKNADLKGLRLYVDKRNIKAQKVYKVLGMNSDHYDLYEWMPS